MAEQKRDIAMAVAIGMLVATAVITVIVLAIDLMDNR